MTPQQHLDRAELLLETAYNFAGDWSEAERIGAALVAIGDVLFAAAIELGAPHAAGPAGGASSG
jgi:hypothetical protein